MFEVGTSFTDVGDERGERGLAYGMGLEASYAFLSEGGAGVVIGGDLHVRGFEVNLPERVESGVGVFDQSDLYLDQYIGAQFRGIVLGAYFEQRRIDRGTPLGKIGFPVTGIGAIVRVDFDGRGRAVVRVSYARFGSGELRLQGLDSTSPLDTGQSVRIAGRFKLATRWGVSIEYSDTEIAFESRPPTLGFFDHHQRLVSAGIVLMF